MKSNFLWIILIALAFCSCEKDDNSNENLSKNPPQIPEAINYDLNDDSVDDIRIEYSWFTWDGINSSGDGISGEVKPLNDCSILFKHKEYSLFIEFNDTIKANINEPYYWEKYLSRDLVSISNSSDNEYLWPNEWIIQSGLSLDFYYLGLEINNLIGWIKVEVDKSTGTIQVVDKKFTTAEFILVGK